MKIAFIAAMPGEFRAVTRHLEAADTKRIAQYRVCSGTFSGNDILAIESGMGFDNAARATEALFGIMRPDILLSVGFCGGIAPDLGVGDVVVATGLVMVSGDVVEEVQAEFATIGSDFVTHQSMSANRVFGGLFVSTPAITAKAHIATLLPTDASHPVVEMESSAIALVAAKNGVKFVGMRSVSDPTGEELGFSLDEFCDDRMRIRIPRVLFTIMQKPRIIPQLIRLSRNSKIAEKNLAQTVWQFLDFL